MGFGNRCYRPVVHQGTGAEKQLSSGEEERSEGVLAYVYVTAQRLANVIEPAISFLAIVV